LILLVDCFYLPHTEGPEAERLLLLVDHLLTEPIESWGNAYAEFSNLYARIQTLFDRLTELRDRELFDVWSRYAWELKEELHIIDAALVQKKAGRDPVVGIELENHLPGTFRGGMLARLQHYLTMDAQGMVRVRTTP
jgi:hypothetical protein